MITPSKQRNLKLLAWFVCVVTLLLGCGDDTTTETSMATTAPVQVSDTRLTFNVTPGGGVLDAGTTGLFAGLQITLPADAVDMSGTLTVDVVNNNAPLPAGAVSVGQNFMLQSDQRVRGTVQVSVPFDPASVSAQGKDVVQVKVWRIQNGVWALTEPIMHTETAAVIELQSLTTVAAGLE